MGVGVVTHILIVAGDEHRILQNLLRLFEFFRNGHKPLQRLKMAMDV